LGLRRASITLQDRRSGAGGSLNIRGHVAGNLGEDTSGSGSDIVGDSLTSDASRSGNSGSSVNGLEILEVEDLRVGNRGGNRKGSGSSNESNNMHFVECLCIELFVLKVGCFESWLLLEEVVLMVDNGLTQQDYHVLFIPF